MALPFNPFEKTKSKTGSGEKKKFTKVKVFERADFEIENVQDSPIVPEKGEETNLQRQSRESLEISFDDGTKLSNKTSISRESPIEKLEMQNRISRESPESYSPLLKVVGLQRQVLFTIFSILQSNGSRASPPIAIQIIADRVNTTVGNTQNAIKELIKKNLVLRKDFFRGRGGWTIYELDEAIYSTLDKERIRESLESLQRISIQQSGAITRETPPISSSSLNISKELNTNEFKIPEALKKVISKKEIESLLSKQLLTEDELTQSLEHFAYDYEHGLVRSKSPVNLLFGLCRTGKVYKSLKLIEIENAELKEYERSIQEAELENQRLKKIDLKTKFEEYKKSNPQIIEQTRALHNILAKSSDDLVETVAFQEFAKENQEGS